MKRKVALFGGGFNPIAMQHQLIGQTIWTEETLRMPTWYMPCYKHRFVKDDDLIDPSHRWNMVVEVTNQFEYMEACDWEMANQHDGFTWETLVGLTKQWPDVDFHPLIGMDNANLMLKPLDQGGWKRGDWLIENYPFLVLQRAGEEPKTDWFQREPHCLVPFNYRISSTAIRKAIKRGDHDFAREHLNQRVWDYIVTGGLYGYEGPENG